MIKGYISTYKQLELYNKHLVDQQVELYSISSPLYDKNKLRQAMQTYKLAKELPGLVSKYTAKWASQKTPVK